MSRRSPKSAHLVEAAPVFAALGDATRLALVARPSASGPTSTVGLTAESTVTRQAITKHLTVLAGAGLVRDVRRGRERTWEINPDRLTEAHAYLDEISQQWDEALDRLKAFVEE